MASKGITSKEMINELVKDEAFNDYQRKQIERIRAVAFEEGRMNINNNLYTNNNRNDE